MILLSLPFNSNEYNCIDNAVIGFLVLCSTGGMTQADIKRMMKYVARTFNIPILNEIVDAESDSALTVRFLHAHILPFLSSSNVYHGILLPNRKCILQRSNLLLAMKVRF